KGRSIAIACPKLDEGQDVYIEKTRSMIEDAKINTLTVMIMEVPCCTGLLHLARQAQEASKRKVPIKSIVVSLKGEILSEEWM
ncbi:MAG: 4Fe-4S ferredoxin, partial [Thermodesulfobacteriota bacterium]